MKKQKLRTHLILNIVTFVIILIILMAVLLALLLTNRIEQMTFEKTENTLRIIELQLTHYLEHPKNELELLSDILQKNDENAQENILLFLEHEIYIDRVDLIDSEGKVINTFPYNPNIIGFDLSRSNTFKKIVDSNQSYILGEMLMDPFLKKTTIYATMKSGDNYLVGYLNLDEFEKFFNNISVKDGYIGLVDEYGTYVSHTNKTFVELRFVDDNVSLIHEGLMSNESKVTYQGIKSVLMYRELKPYNWYILYYQNSDAINAPIIKAIVTVILLILVFIPFLVFLVVRITQRMNMTLDNLVVVTKRIANGKYAIHDIDFYYEEFNNLFSHVSQMSHDVESREEQISSLNNELSSSYYTVVVLLAKAIEAKDMYTGNHCERVRDYSMLLGTGYGLNDEDLNELKFGSTLHDIGKLGVPENILNKPGRFTEEEYSFIKHHSQIGYDIMKEMPSMLQAKQIILHHHECFDGTGYPYGLSGLEIPLLARIVTIADAFDAMTTERSYKKQPMSKKDGFEELRRWAGTQFDPELTELFIELVKQSI